MISPPPVCARVTSDGFEASVCAAGDEYLCPDSAAAAADDDDEGTRVYTGVLKSARIPAAAVRAVAGAAASATVDFRGCSRCSSSRISAAVRGLN